MGYLKDTLRGISWMGGLRGATRVIAFVKVLVLARILLPSEFGLFAISMLLLSFLEIVSETGVNIFLIQEDKDINTYVNTSWVVSIARGIFISLVIFLLAPFVSVFFKSPDSLDLVRLISIVPLIRGFINPSIIKLQKNLLFSKEFTFRLSIYILDASVAVIFALVTGSAISMVYGLMAGAFLEVALSLLIIKPHPQFKFAQDKFICIIHRGKWVTLAGIFNFLFENIDDAVVGRFLNTSSLGSYQMAYKISSFPMTEISDVIQKVTFPIYTKIVDDKLRLKKAFVKSLLSVSFLVIPFGIFLFFFSREVVLILLGENWLSVIPVVKVLAFFGVARAITETSYPLLLSLKKQKYVSIIALFTIIGLTISVVPLVKNFDIVGAGLSALIGALFAVPITVYFLNKVFK